ncbi:hypothetical protein BaRGS_00035158 [Batillaria attramentaria]|uniref:Mutator-like transposase domain-containing protein n=1 Tax=Batillaria attramentaria TaxID=370345 RepID=A0ABD0JG85_9CAEN
MEYFLSLNSRQESSDGSEDEDDEGEEDMLADDAVGEDGKLNMIVNLGCLQSLISSGAIACRSCKRSNLTVIEGGHDFREGSSCLLQLHCFNCGKLATEYTSSKTGTVHTGFDANRRLVAAATSNGIGYSQRLHTGVKRAANRDLQDVAHVIRTTYADMNIGIPDANGVLDISISIDGSWHKRGRTSHNGVVCVIDLITGLIIDFVALSNYCQVCESEAAPSPGDANYDDWFAGHKDQCQQNIQCSSQAMEMEGAVILFQRSEERGFRYTEMLGDGDTKPHAKLLEEDVYNGRPIEKIECVNHVTKRLGTALRTLVEKRKAQGQPIGGRGKLTAERIKKLTNYYGRAIKDNKGNLDATVNAVWASFFHTLSSDASHNHNLCPDGPKSWCFFKRALANNVEPGHHSKELPASVEVLKPVYQRLGDPQLLSRCLQGKTQNSNEAFHSVLWRLCPKERWASLRSVETALAIAVQQFNKGSSALLDVMVELEILTDRPGEEYAAQQDASRVVCATRKSSKKEKERRKKIDAIYVKSAKNAEVVRERSMALGPSKGL